MSHSEVTDRYGLPQFELSDTPAWIADINPAMVDIDSGIYNAAEIAINARNSAADALATANEAKEIAEAGGGVGPVSVTTPTTNGKYIIITQNWWTQATLQMNKAGLFIPGLMLHLVSSTNPPTDDDLIDTPQILPSNLNYYYVATLATSDIVNLGEYNANDPKTYRIITATYGENAATNRGTTYPAVFAYINGETRLHITKPFNSDIAIWNQFVLSG